MRDATSDSAAGFSLFGGVGQAGRISPVKQASQHCGRALSRSVARRPIQTFDRDERQAVGVDVIAIASTSSAAASSFERSGMSTP